MASSKSVEKSSHLAFLMLKRLLNGVGCGTITGWTVTQIGRCCVRGTGSRTDFPTHIRNVLRYKDEVRVVSFLLYSTVEWFRQFRVVDEWQSVWICPLFDRFSVTIRCGVSPEGTVWLLKSPFTMWGLILCPSGGSRNGSDGGSLYSDGTTHINTVANGFNQMAPPARTITVVLDMSTAFDTIHMHTLIRKLIQPKIPGTII